MGDDEPKNPAVSYDGRKRCSSCGRYRDKGEWWEDEDDDRCRTCRQAQSQTTMLMDLPGHPPKQG